MAKIVVLFIIFLAILWILMSMCHKMEIADVVVHSILLEILLFAISACFLYYAGFYSVGKVLYLDMGLVLLLLIPVLFIRKPDFAFSAKKRCYIITACLILFVFGALLTGNGLYDGDSFLGKMQKDGMWLTQGNSQQEFYEETISGIAQMQQTPQMSVPKVFFGAVSALVIDVFGYRVMLYEIPFIVALLAYELCLLLIKVFGSRKVSVFIALLAGICVLPALLKTSGKEKIDGWEMFEQLATEITADDIVMLDKTVADDLYLPIRSITSGAAVAGDMTLDEVIASYCEVNADKLADITTQAVENGSYNEYNDIGNLYYISDTKTERSDFTVVYNGELNVYKYYTGAVTLPKADNEILYKYIAVLFGIALLVMCAMYILCAANAVNFLKAHNKIIAIAAVVAVYIFYCAFRAASLPVFLLVSLVVAAAFFGLSVLYKKRDCVELFVLAALGAVFGYILVTAVLLAVNGFAVSKAVILDFVLWVVLDIAIYLVKRTRPSVTFQWKKNRVPLIMCLIVLPLMFFDNGLFGMGQDQGVYMAKAYGYLKGYNDNYMSFKEYDNLKTDEERQSYLEMLDGGLGGYYLLLDEEGTDNIWDSTAVNDTTARYHGIHTFSALLALTGSIAGESNMLHWGIVCFMLSLCLLWFILRNSRVSEKISALALVLYACAPQLVWQAKTSLVETTLALVILTFIYFITDKQYEEYRALACVAVAVFAVLHITIYVFMPMFVVIFYYLFFKNKKKSYMVAALVSILAYLGGFYMMYCTSLVYVYGNYDRMYHFGINSGNIKKFVTVFCIFAAVLTVLLMFVLPKLNAFKKHGVHKNTKLTAAAVYVLTALSVLGFVFVQRTSSFPLTGLTIYAYWLAGGMLTFPVIFVGALIKPDIFRKNDSTVVLSIMFLYCIVLYSIVFKREVIYYNYYARYIVPYVAVVIILAAYVFSELRLAFISGKNVSRAVKTDFVSALAVLFVVSLLAPYLSVAATQQDETEIQWQTIQSIESSTDTSGSCAVILDTSLARQFMIPVKYATGADIYLASDVESQFSKLRDKYEHVYYLTDEEFTSDEQNNIKNICDIQNKIQLGVMNPAKITGLSSLIPYSGDNVIYWQRILMYE